MLYSITEEKTHKTQHKVKVSEEKISLFETFLSLTCVEEKKGEHWSSI